MKIGVMGTGGVGGYFGGLLARDGHDVTFVARGAHLAAIQQHGLKVDSTNDGSFTAPGNAVEDTSEAGPQDLVLFNVKMFQNAPAIEATKPLVGPDTIVLTQQNGVDNGDQLAAALGADHVMIGSAFMEGRIVEPGVVSQGGPGTANFGELQPGITERGRNLLEVFQHAGWRVELQENMPGMLWMKFAAIAGPAAVNAATNSVYEEMRTLPETRALIIAAMEETLSVGKASGAPIIDGTLERAINAMDNFPAQGRASLAKDFSEGHMVELEGITGILVRLGRETGTPTPVNNALYAILTPWANRIQASFQSL